MSRFERNGGNDAADDVLGSVPVRLPERRLREDRGRRGRRDAAVAGERGVTGLPRLAARRHRPLRAAEHRHRTVLLHPLSRAPHEAADRGGLHPQENHPQLPERAVEDQQCGDGRDGSAER